MEKPCRKGNSLPLACSPLCEVERVDTELRKLMSQHAVGAHDGVCMRVSLFYAAPFCAALQGPSAAAWLGAGRPRPSLPAAELPPLLMQALQLNDFPEIDAGLHAMWAFVGDSTRFIYKNNETEFIEDAHTTANTLPTSFYGMAMHGREWEMETELTRGQRPRSRVDRHANHAHRVLRWANAAMAMGAAKAPTPAQLGRLVR